MLQRQAPRSGEMMDTSDDSPTPSPKAATTPILSREVTNNIDPALSGVTSPTSQSDSGESARDRAEELWIENIRVVEALRKYIADRLDKKQYDDDEEDVSMSGTSEGKTEEKKEEDGESLYPVLRADDD